MSTASSKKANTSHYLGIDFGRSKIGFAVSDSETRIAFPYGVLKNDKKIFKKIAEIVEKKKIEKIVIGSAGREAKIFADILKKNIGIAAVFHNEMFSTIEAERNLKKRGTKKIKRFDDQEAARIILQSWLDKKE